MAVSALKNAQKQEMTSLIQLNSNHTQALLICNNQALIQLHIAQEILLTFACHNLERCKKKDQMIMKIIRVSLKKLENHLMDSTSKTCGYPQHQFTSVSELPLLIVFWSFTYSVYLLSTLPGVLLLSFNSDLLELLDSAPCSHKTKLSLLQMDRPVCMLLQDFLQFLLLSSVA